MIGKVINCGELQYLSRIYNAHLIPTIMCTWEDSVFPHNCGYIFIEIIIQRYLQHCEIKLIDNKNLKKVKWSRDDYLEDYGDEDCWLMDIQFKIRPTIAFIDGTMEVLTCKYHDGGMHVWWYMHDVGSTSYLLINLIKFNKL